MKLTLIRHGNTEANEKRLYYGSTDLPLSAEGKRALERTASRFVFPSAQRYYTSGMLRSEQTFAILYGDIPHEPLYGLREMNFGSFEMRAYDELKNDAAFLEWISGDAETNICPGGESGASVLMRSYREVEKLLDSCSDAVVITHGGVIGGLMAKFFPTYVGRYAYTPDPGFGVTITFDGHTPVYWNAEPGETV